MQILSNSAYWTTTPASITLTSYIGGGSGNHDLADNVYAILLDSNGDEISSTATSITSKITNSSGDTYNTSIPVTNNVYGIRIYHAKETGFNVRYFSFSLSYEEEAADPDKASADFSFTTTSYNVNDLEADFTEPTLNKADGYDGTVEYSSDNTDVATVNATTGEVTLVGEGVAVIRATADATENFNAGNASYTITVSLKSVTITFDEAEIEMTVGEDVAINGITCDADYTGTITYTSSGAGLTVDPSTGKLTAVATGTYKITATASQKGKYKETTATYDVTVNFAIADGVFDFTQEGVNYGSGYSESSVKVQSATWTAVNVEMTTAGRNAWGASSKQLDLRLYAKSGSDAAGSITFEVPAGKTITKIVFTGSSLGNVSASVGSYSAGTWTGDAESVVFTASNTVNITSAIVTYDDPIATIGSAGYATYVAPIHVEVPAAIHAYKVTAASTTATLEEVASIEAGQAVILQGAADSYNMTGIDEKDVIDDFSDNLLLASDGKVEGDGSTIYVLANGDEGIGFYLLVDGSKLPTGKAYLNTAGGEAKSFIGFNFEGKSNAIENVSLAEELSNGRIFNLAGQQLKSLQKGINIVNGKKIFVK